MQLGNTNIITPMESPIGYNPDWRRRVALELANGATTIGLVVACPFKVDEYIAAYRDFTRCISLRRNKQGTIKFKLPKKYADYEQVLNWYSGEATGVIFKHYVEAFLLTNLPYEAIAQHLTTQARLIGLYEKLFYNVRDNVGADKGSPAFKISFIKNLEGKLSDTSEYKEYQSWKYSAATRGSDYLLTVLECNSIVNKLPVANAIAAASQSKFVHSLNKGRVKNYELIEMIRTSNDIERVAIESSSKLNVTDPSSVSVCKLMQDILGDVAPRMDKTGLTELELGEKNKVLQDKLAAAKVVDSATIKDNKADAYNDLTAAIKQRVERGN